MASKRKDPGNDPMTNSNNKRSKLVDIKSNDSPKPSQQSKVDPTYGQRGAFPGLDDITTDDDLFYGPADDGLDYLRMVRHEAASVPNLLVAPLSPSATIPAPYSSSDDIYAPYPTGYYSDGAYTAHPLPQDSTKESPASDLDPQEEYYASLRARFLQLRAALSTPPPHPPPSQTVSALRPLLSTKRSVWRGKLLKTSPTPLILANLPQEIVVYALEVLGDVMTLREMRKGREGRNLGLWAWGLLGRCREVGQMGSEEVGVLRGVGKQAGWLTRRVGVEGQLQGEQDVLDGDEGEGGEDGEEDEEGGEEVGAGVCAEGEDDVGEGIQDDPDGLDRGGDAGAALPNGENHEAANFPAESSEDLEEIRRRLLSSLDSGASTDDVEIEPEISPSKTQGDEERAVPAASETKYPETTPDIDIYATLDMILTVVGEFYGQRDLLEGRILWDEMS